MVLDTRLTLVIFVCIQLCKGQLVKFRNSYDVATTPLPFPACRADHIECLRRGLRTFFYLMDVGHMGMAPVDPMVVNSVAVGLPEQQLSFLMRRVNVTGARWTRLLERKFNLPGGKSGVRFSTDLHVTAEISMMDASRIEPYFASITMDIQDMETNITYPWSGRRGFDNEDYILIGAERIAVRNMRTPTFFVQPRCEESLMIEQTLFMKPSILDHMTNEIGAALMHSVVDNFRLFASNTPVKYYYKYF